MWRPSIVVTGIRCSSTFRGLVRGLARHGNVGGKRDTVARAGGRSSTSTGKRACRGGWPGFPRAGGTGPPPEVDTSRAAAGVVVEIDEQPPAVARLDGAVRVAVERSGHRPACDVLEEVLAEQRRRRSRDRTRLRGRRCRPRHQIDEHVCRWAFDSMVCLSIGTRLSSLPRPERATKSGPFQRHGHQQVEGDLPFVIGDRFFAPGSIRWNRESGSTETLRSSSIPPKWRRRSAW